MYIVRYLLLAILAICINSCSSAPPQKEEEVEQKNQAVQFAESGNEYYNQGLYDQALSFFRLSLAYNGAVYNEKGMIESYNSIGKTYIATGSFDLAAASFEKAIDIARIIEDKELIATCLNNMAELAINQKQYDKALALLKDALSTGAGMKPSRFAVIHHNMGIVQKRLGNTDLAIASFKTALDINLPNKNYKEVASNYYMLASSFSEKNDYKTALDYAHKALDMDKRFENSLGIAKDFFALGILSEKSGKDADAYQFFKSSLLIYDSLATIRPTLELQDDKKALLDSLTSIAQKLGDDTAAAEYSRSNKELER